MMENKEVKRPLQLFPDPMTSSAPIFMTLPALQFSNVKSSLEQDTMRALTVSEANAQPILRSDNGFLKGTGVESLVLPVPERVPGLLPKKIDFFSMRTVAAALPQSSGPQAPLLPSHVERFSAFVSARDPPTIMRACVAYLDKIKMDYQYTPLRFKLSGVGYDSSASYNFKIKIFAHRTSTSLFVCEVQRRSGDVVAFSNFYRTLLANLGSDIVDHSYLEELSSERERAKLSNNSSGIATLPLPSFNLAPVSLTGNNNSVGPGQVILDEQTTTCLLDMSNCRETDILRESMRTLSAVSSLPQNQAKLLSTTSTGNSKTGLTSPQHQHVNTSKDTRSRVIQLVASMLVSKDKECVRCAATLLSNIMQQPGVHPQLLTLVPGTVSLLDASDSSETSNSTSFLAAREIKRQIARALLRLSGTSAKDIDKTLKMSYVVALDKALRGTNDDQLKPVLLACILALDSSYKA
jgi:hypothetical protein